MSETPDQVEPVVEEPVVEPPVIPAAADKPVTKEYIIDGTRYNLTDKDREDAVTYAIQALRKEKAEAKVKEEETSTKKEKVETKEETKLEQRLAKLEQALIAGEQRRNSEVLLTAIQSRVASVPELKGISSKVQKAIVAEYATQRQQMTNPDLNAIINTEIEDFKKLIGGSTVNVEKKEKTKEELSAGTASGKGAGTDAPRKRDRHSFRNKELTDDVFKYLKGLSNKVTE